MPRLLYSEWWLLALPRGGSACGTCVPGGGLPLQHTHCAPTIGMGSVAVFLAIYYDCHV